MRNKVFRRLLPILVCIVLALNTLPPITIHATNAPTGNDIVSLALSKVGCSYELGAKGPNKFDCVGLVVWCYGQYGISLPMGTSSYSSGKWASYGTKITSVDSLQPGDVVFYGSSESNISHAAIYQGNYKTVHALNPSYGVIKDVYITSQYGPATAASFSGNFLFGLRVYGISGNASSVTDVTDDARFRVVEVDTITATNARIGFLLNSSTTIQNCGIVVGKKSDLSDGKWAFEWATDTSYYMASGTGGSYGLDSNGNPNLSSRWGITLTSGTKYYYKVFIKAGGVTYYSNIRSFTTNSIAVTKLTLNQSSLSLKTNDTYQLSVSVSPTDASNKQVTWTSSNASVCTVSSNGKVTAVSAGTATITATAKDGSGKKATCTITVTPSTIYVTNISLNTSSISIKDNESYQLNATIAPSNASNKGINWNSSNTSIATVDSNGLVSGVSAGTAIITATAKDGSGKKATCTVTVTSAAIYVTDILLNVSSISIKKNESYQLVATIVPSNASNQGIIWKSSDTSVATVDSNGLVKGVSAGTSTITATANDGSGRNVSCSVTVNVSNNERAVDFSEFVAPEGCVFQLRLYNPNSGEHFYTGSHEETMNLVNAGWNFEGAGFITPTVGVPIYRLYSEEHGDHFYTTDESERDALIAEGWKNEGVAFPSATVEDGWPMYRLYNKNAYPSGKAGAHHFTMSWDEVQNLVAVGWEYEKIAWYSVQN